MSSACAKISVKVQPNAGRNEVTGLSNGVWRIKIAAPPDKGKANKELIEFLSQVLGLKKNALDIMNGHTSHSKVISIEGLTPEEIVSRLTRKK
jgi:uncharacterized protein